MKAIRSAENPQFRAWLRLATAPRAARAAGATLAEGLHLAEAALEAGAAVQGLIMRQGERAADVEALVARFAAAVPRWELAAALYERIAPVEQGAGLLLVLAVPAPALPQALAADMVYLDGVQDPGNVGTLIRTAAAAGVRHVLAGPGTAALWSPRVLRAGMGAHFRVALHEHVAAAQLGAVLRGTWIAAVAHDAPSLWSADWGAGAVGWLLGAEGAGLSPEALACAGARVRIPTSSAVESLNVGAAAAVCLFERLRRRQGGGATRGSPAAP